MSRDTTRVDCVALAWIARQPEPSTMLNAVVEHFRRSSGKLGYVLTSEAAARMGGGRTDQDLDIFRLSPEGTLTSLVTDPSRPIRVEWDHGVLRLSGPGGTLPATIVAAMPGRLGDVVTHALLPADAVVVSTRETPSGLELECQEFSVTMAEALDHLEQQEGKAA